MRFHLLRFPYYLLGIIVFTASTAAEEERLPPAIRDYLAIEIDEIEFKETHMDDALGFIRIKAKDVQPDGLVLGTIMDTPAAPRQKVITYSGKAVTLDEIYTVFAEHFGLDIHVTSVGLRILPAGSELRPEPLGRKRVIYKTYRPKK